jgi:hypothetical protein
MTTQHRNTKTNIHAWSRIRTHDPSNQAVKTYALDCVATRTSFARLNLCKMSHKVHSVVNVSFLCFQWFFFCAFIFSYKCKHAEAYIHIHVYYSNDFYFYKTRVIQDLQERNDCINWVASVFSMEQAVHDMCFCYTLDFLWKYSLCYICCDIIL